MKVAEKVTPTHVFFPVNIAKFLRTAFFIEHLRWLLLNMCLLSTVLFQFTHGVRRIFLISCSRVTFVSLNTFFLAKAFLKNLKKENILLDLVDIVFWLIS